MRKIREKSNIDRRNSHFILTPFDVERGRGLRALGREIAKSFVHQIRKKEGRGN